MNDKVYRGEDLLAGNVTPGEVEPHGRYRLERLPDPELRHVLVSIPVHGPGPLDLSRLPRGTRVEDDPAYGGGEQRSLWDGETNMAGEDYRGRHGDDRDGGWGVSVDRDGLSVGSDEARHGRDEDRGRGRFGRRNR